MPEHGCLSGKHEDSSPCILRILYDTVSLYCNCECICPASLVDSLPSKFFSTNTVSYKVHRILSLQCELLIICVIRLDISDQFEPGRQEDVYEFMNVLFEVLREEAGRHSTLDHMLGFPLDVIFGCNLKLVGESCMKCS